MDCPPTLVTPSQLPASILPPPNLLTSPNQAPAKANPNLLQKTACLPLQASSQVESYKMPFLQLLDQSYTGDIIWSDLLLGSLCLLLNFQSVPSLGCTPDMNDFLPATFLFCLMCVLFILVLKVIENEVTTYLATKLLPRG